MPVIVSVRADVPEGVKLAEHVAEAPLPLIVQGEPLNVPVPLLLKVTLPAGVVGVLDVSITVAVQFVEAPIATLAGVQETVVVVAAAVTTAFTFWSVWLG